MTEIMGLGKFFINLDNVCACYAPAGRQSREQQRSQNYSFVQEGLFQR
jgi:hypothetical protein